METPAQAQPKKSNTGLIIGIVVVVLLCCCLLLAVGFVVMAPAVQEAFSKINQQLSTPTPDYSAPPSATETPDSFDFSSGFVPTGGRGDDILRTDTWGYVIIASASVGCSSNPSAPDTTIEITQDPDSNGIWEEQWTVICDDGSSKAFDITFTPSPQGGTDISVKAAK